MNLTIRKIDQLTVDAKQRDRLVFDDTQRGLAVRVTATGGKTYLAQFTLHGTKYRVPLGSCSALSLAKAREATAVIMGEVAKGKNPALERKEAAAKARRAHGRLTLEQLIANWHRLHLAHLRSRYSSEATRALRHAFRRYLDQPAEELDRATIVRVLDGITRNSGTNGETRGHAMSSRTAAYGRAAFAWAVKRGTVEFNPFGNLPVSARIIRRERVLNDDELRTVWQAAIAATFPFGAIVCMLALTGQRREEVSGMAWAEISNDLNTWTIPAARTKNGATHVVPLSALARELLQRLPREGSLVFPGDKGTPFSGWGKSKTRLDETSGTTNWRLHDLRRTLATGLQRLGVRLEVTEAVLNHISGSRAGIVGVYQRHDWQSEKRAALEAWSAHILELGDGRRQAGNVVNLERRSSSAR